MADKHWDRWVMQTARSWEDLAPIIKETGISYVDHDHRRLTEYALELNELLLRMEDQFNLDLVEEQQLLLDRFLDYTAEHFEREEGFLKKYKLPGLDIQVEEHRSIVRRLKDIMFEFKTGRISSAFKLRLEILDWVIRHINSTDNEVFDFLNICESILEIDSWEDISGFIRNVHVPPVDADHKLLTEAIMEVGRKIRGYSEERAGEDLAPLIDALEKALHQTNRHFSREEELIRKYSIPGESTQQDQHRKFVNYLTAQLELMKEGETQKLHELERELLFWWIQHINIYDYKTFSSSHWVSRVFQMAEEAGDVYWLISPTGHEVIDEDHKEFVVLLFSFEYLINPDADKKIHKDECLRELSELIAYARNHFSREEEIMQQQGVEGFERHHKDHLDIIRKLEEHGVGLENDLIDLSPQLKNMLLSWWINHTNGMDFETFGACYE